MTLEDIYKWAMTPLPPPPDLSPQVQRLIDLIRKHTPNAPTIPELPTMPASWPRNPNYPPNPEPPQP